MSKNHKQKNNSKKLQNISVRWQMTSFKGHRILHFPPQSYSHMQTVGISPRIVESKHTCLLTGKDKETAPFVSRLLTPYLCKPRFASKPKGRRWAIKQFSKWVITTPAQTLCGFKIVRTWRNVLIRETWVCVLGAPPPEHMGSGFMFQSLWNSHCGTDVLTEKGN